MIERGPASEDDMVLAFVRAEIDSSRYGVYIRDGLAQLGLNRHLIDEPDLADAVQNLARRQVLAFRGYPQEALFTDFPLDARWRRVGLEAFDVRAMRYIDDTRSDRHWVTLTDGTRLVSDGARNFRQRSADSAMHHISAIAEALRNGVTFPELIAAQADDGSLILIEGHSRATAYVMEGFAGEVDALVASSPSMSRWFFY